MTTEPSAEALPRTGKGTGGDDPRSSTEAMTWDTAQQKFREGGWYWLGTARRDGTPHVVPVMAAWAAPVFYVAANPATRKSRDLAENAKCVLTRDTGDAHLIVEGTARRVTDDDGLHRVSDAFGDGWPLTVSGTVLDADFGAPTSRGAPFAAWEITPGKAFAFPTDGTSFAPTRWRFDATAD